MQGFGFTRFMRFGVQDTGFIGSRVLKIPRDPKCFVPWEI